MLYRLRASPLPYGGAVQLQLLTSQDAQVLVLATGSAAPPTGRDDPNARVVHDGPLRWPTTPAGVWSPPPSGQAWYQVLDLETERLPDGKPVTYHISAGGGAPESVTVTPRCVMTTVGILVRDVIRARMEYHLARAVKEKRFGQGVKKIPVAEQEVLAQGHPVPMVLIKERAVPDNSDTIGKGRGEVVMRGGEAAREYVRGARATLDIFVLTDNPQHRAGLGLYLYEVLHQDLPYFEAAGLQGTTVMRHDVHSIEAALNIYGSELSVECLTQVITTQQIVEKIINNNSIFITP